MKGKATIMAAVMLFALANLSSAIPPDELPFGAMYLEEYDSDEVELLSDDMRFNYLVEYTNILDSEKIGLLFDEGIQSIRGGIDAGDWQDSEAPMKYSWANYAEIDVAYPYPNEEARMVAFGGQYSQDGSMWISARDSQDYLSGLSTYLEKYDGDSVSVESWRSYITFVDKYFNDILEEGKIRYQIDLRMKIDSRGDNLTDTVAIVICEIGDFYACEMHPETLGVIIADSFSYDNTFETVSMTFIIPDTITYYHEDESHDCTVEITDILDEKRYKYGVSLVIATTGEREVSVDSITISDSWGRELVNGDYDDVITSVFQQYSGISSKIYGWMLMDEPVFCNYGPFGYIESLMHTVDSNWVVFTDFNDYWFTINTYFKNVEKDFVNVDIYPFKPSDPYAGNEYQYIMEDGSHGSLSRLSVTLGKVRHDVDLEGKEFWVTPQAFEDDPPELWRFPTASELSCQTFLALAWGCKGIQYWFYYNTGNPNLGRGIRGESGDSTALYFEIKDHIGPYIQAVDEYYMPLEWRLTYTYHDGEPQLDPPSGSYISSISAWVHPDSIGINPDAGWFHVGEFIGPVGDTAKYVMLVNRACSQGELDSDPAPSITAIVRFDPANLGLGDYVYIIDLATGTDSSDWVGIPDTTYSANLDGIIPFTTVLGPGEGRLFKIVGTVQQ